MDEYGLDWEAAALLYAVESGDAMVDDVVFEWTEVPEPATTDQPRETEASKVPAIPRR
jgi:hypothetical protein